MISFATSSLSSSTKDFPTLYPLALRNVNDIAPPISIVSTLSSKFVKTAILLDTLAPPIIATSGRCGALILLSKALISFSIKNPHTAGI